MAETTQFVCDEVTGVVSVVGTLDREVVSSYDLTLVATDQGDSPRSTELQIMVEVGDVNDSPPTFINPSYTGNVSRTARPGDFVSAVASNVNGQTVEYNTRFFH